MDNETCTDCGTRPRWWRSDSDRRQCSDKGGHTYLSRVEVDADKVLAFFEGDKAKAEEFFTQTDPWR